MKELRTLPSLFPSLFHMFSISAIRPGNHQRRRPELREQAFMSATPGPGGALAQDFPFSLLPAFPCNTVFTAGGEAIDSTSGRG